MQEMRRRAILAVFLVLIAAFFAGYWWLRPLTGRPGPSDSAERRDAETPGQKEDSLPPLLYREMAEQTRRVVGVMDSPLAQRKGDEYITKYHSFVNDSDVRVRIPPGKADRPLIEMRFWKPTPAGELRPLRIVDVGWGQWLSIPLDEGGGNVREWGGVGVRATAVRVPVYPPEAKTESHIPLIFGKRYLIRLNYPKNDEMYESVVRIPDRIPRGKMYVVDVIAKYPAYAFEGRTLKLMRDKSEFIKGRILSSPPLPSHELRVEYFNVKKREKRSGVPYPDGTFKVRGDDLGHTLRVTKPQSAGQGWLYIRSVEKRKLSLPRDADLVVRKKDLVQFTLRLDPNHLTRDLASVGLKVNEEDHVPMCWVNFDGGHKHLLKKLQDTGRLEMSFIPGRWYVALLNWPEGADLAQRQRKVIGKITVRKSDRGKTLAVEPLEK
jgi:hypothetical protein